MVRKSRIFCRNSYTDTFRSQVRRQSRRLPAEFLRCRPLRATHLIPDRTARAPSVCRAFRVAAPGWHALRTCMRLCGCAGGSYPSHPASPVHQPHGSEALGVNEPQPRDHQLASVAYWYGPAVCAVSFRRIRHIADGKRASGCSHVTLSTGRPLPAYSRRLVSLQAARSLCHAYGMHASRGQQRRQASGTPPPLAHACATMVIAAS